MPGKNHIKTTNGWPIKKLFWPFCFITQNQRLKNIVRDHLDEVYIVPYFVSKCFFCWLGHFKVSFYYPHPINRAGGSILTLGQVASLGIWLEILCDFDLCTTG